MLRFVHLTDTHIGPTESFTLYAREPLRYLRAAVDAINALPFKIDFVLHTGDVVDDASAESYALYEQTIGALRVPIHHVVGNHDSVELLQSIVMNLDNPADRLDYTFDAGGVRFIVLDTRGPIDPGGHVTDEQLVWLAGECGASELPIVIAMHHSAVLLDTPWLDAPPQGWDGRFMFIDNAEQVRAILAGWAGKIRGVLSGHVHGSFAVSRDGILYAPSQSLFAGLTHGPHVFEVDVDPSHRGVFNVISVDAQQMTIRPITFET